MVLDAILEQPWAKEAWFQEHHSAGVPSIKATLDAPDEGKVTVSVVFLWDSFGAVWQAEWTLGATVKRVNTNDADTLHRFLQGIPVFEGIVHNTQRFAWEEIEQLLLDIRAGARTVVREQEEKPSESYVGIVVYRVINKWADTGYRIGVFNDCGEFDHFQWITRGGKRAEYEFLYQDRRCDVLQPTEEEELRIWQWE